jgi:DNA mismatch endonuclease, patch repair protein
MQANRSRDTGPEIAIRSILHRKGYRYLVSARPLPGLRRTADMVFRGPKVAVFIDGCFWHGCPQHHTVASTNAEYWQAKVHENRTRDADTDRLMKAAGWTSIRVWEHEEPVSAADRIAQVVDSNR